MTTYYLTSDQLRYLTKRGSSFLQIIVLQEMCIAYDLDPHGTPLVRTININSHSQIFNMIPDSFKFKKMDTGN